MQLFKYTLCSLLAIVVAAKSTAENITVIVGYPVTESTTIVPAHGHKNVENVKNATISKLESTKGPVVNAALTIKNVTVSATNHTVAALNSTKNAIVGQTAKAVSSVKHTVKNDRLAATYLKRAALLALGTAAFAGAAYATTHQLGKEEQAKKYFDAGYDDLKTRLENSMTFINERASDLKKRIRLSPTLTEPDAETPVPEIEIEDLE